MPKFIEAVANATGRKQRIPAAWLEHPVLGEGFRQTPRAGARKASSPERKAAKATAKQAASTSTAPAADTTNAPVAGDKE